MNKTSIEWTDFTSNPMKFRDAKTNQIVWGCVKVSPGCLHCYSETLALRYKQGKLFNAANMRELKPFMCDDELTKIRTKKKCGGVEVSGKRCFVGDMTDLFGEWVTDAMLDHLFVTMSLRQDVTFQLLTKRAERLRDYIVSRDLGVVFETEKRDFEKTRAYAESTPAQIDVRVHNLLAAHGIRKDPPWPLPNVHLGVSCENQAMADKRLPFLLATPAAVRFVSFEPLLGSINVFAPGCPYPIQNPVGPRVSSGCLDWAIVGGESGHGARPMHPDWAVGLRDQCLAAGVPFFFKQWGEWLPLEMKLHGDNWKMKTWSWPAKFSGQALVRPSGGSVEISDETWTLGLRESRNWPVAKVGKHAAGRLLDGAEWNQFPKGATT